MNNKTASATAYSRLIRPLRTCAHAIVCCSLLPGCSGSSSSSYATVPATTAAPVASSAPASQATAAATGYLPISIESLSYPINFLQAFGPTTQAAQQRLVGRVGAMWSSGYSAQPGIYSMSYAPAYRLYFMPAGWTGAGADYPATQLGWLYYHHPDWIEYGSDGNVLYEFGDTRYPVVDIANPAVRQHLFQSMADNASGYQALSLDNVSAANVRNGAVYQAGHYSDTVSPCPASLRPACGGTFVTQYASADDATWSAANLDYIKYLSAQAKTVGLATVANVSYQGGVMWTQIADAVSGVIEENVPQHQGTTLANRWYNGFMIDDLFAAHLYNAERANQKFYGAISYLDGHDTGGMTRAEETWATAWLLLITQSAQNYLSAGQISSRAAQTYPPSMGGYVDLALTGTLTRGSATVTGLASTRALAAGLHVNGAGIAPGATIATVDSSTSVTLDTAATASAASASLAFSGFPPLPVGRPVAPPPSVDPYASPPAGACGWVNGANAGVCARQYANGWVYMNPVCQYDGSACAVASTAITIPPATSGSRWYDPYCNVVADGHYMLAAATALVIARGSISVCPWPQ
ncbi:hypothetical protein [Caballeronia sp. M1242]|uniref:hypothetical protein n=1 Tax=Caballeronia sp. M1242 TaxID=2814653 RepID=UPI0019D1C1BC|nr:hypothetical protein [Caballeronia sp. M1242]QSN65075.1 hypothetical protein JYK05_24300 [Caballeronia sp. M1242]